MTCKGINLIDNQRTIGSYKVSNRDIIYMEYKGRPNCDKFVNLAFQEQLLNVAIDMGIYVGDLKEFILYKLVQSKFNESK
jgi:hypothetical protein